MSDVYNPETVIREALEARTLEAHDLARRRDLAGTAQDRAVLERQLQETEMQIQRLQRRLGKRAAEGETP